MVAAIPHHIIAIGASAGGVDDINSFFDHTPSDEVSYIIVQHLSSEFKSRMAELLKKHSKLVVKDAENGMPVRCNEVYVIPSNNFMTISANKLYLSDKDNSQSPHLTINTFFNSLAADAGERAIGIIFSGMGSDGAEGVKAIKKAGGMIFARNPETTKFPSMPSGAIATGDVDYILEPALMPAVIEDYVKQDTIMLEDEKNDEKNLKAIIEQIKAISPLDFSEYKQTTILRRTKRRAANNGFNDLKSYLDFLKVTPGEVDALAKEFLISVTAFFRDKEAFEFIRVKVLPELLKKLVAKEELKVWVAGCATGEEVYSMAILIAEQLTGVYKDVKVKIFATDIDSAALVIAGKGIYSSSISKNVSAERLERYFQKEGDTYKVKPFIRKMVIFAQHDLAKNPPYCNMHFISCRNLLIYMTPVLQKKIFNMLLFGLKKESYLFLGSSENPAPIIKNLKAVNKQWKIYKNLETKRVVSFDAFSMPELQETKGKTTLTREDTTKQIGNTLAEAMHSHLANNLGYLTVCIDENNDVIKSYGDTSKYLLQKHFTTNLAELLPKPLAVAFNTLRNIASKDNDNLTVSHVSIEHGDEILKVNLSVCPLSVKKDERKMLMVTFTEDKVHKATNLKDIKFDTKTFHDQYILDLEYELKEAKEKLNTLYEQLDASSENMQSFNEEMISANEEMQSTNEEMQSVNEELETINAEYQLKNKELLELNDDLNNYFRSNINGQLFINNDLLLMKFSPGIVKQINLQESDVGRPLSNISTNIKFETIIDDIKLVLDKGVVITKEIETNNGHWYQISTMPYVRQIDNSNHGAIITFNDITTLKKIQQELDQKNNFLKRINTDHDHFIHAVSHDLLGPLGNIEQMITLMNSLEINDAALKEYLNLINVSIHKFRSLIKEIATIAKVENGVVATENVDINALLDDIEWSLKDKIDLSGAIITRELQVKKVLFSKKNLRSIFYNLISNAIKFKRELPPVITIRTEGTKYDTTLSVEDNGIGLSTKDINKIFELYGRLNQNVEGQGIGLFLTKKIINASGGHMVVKSELGKGSKFIININA